MSVKYFAKVIDMQHVEVAIAHNQKQESALRQQEYERCSRAFYDSALRDAKRQPARK